MRKFLAIAFTAAALAACDKTNITPTAPTAPPVAPTEPTPGLHWPVALPNGGEDPNYPPPPCACPAGFSVAYNGGNFICLKAGEVRMPWLNTVDCK